MLTVTYSLLAIATEQKITRGLLDRLKQLIIREHVPERVPEPATVPGKQAAELPLSYHHLLEIDRFYRARKVEVYLLPAIRGGNAEADALLEDLEMLSLFAERILARLQTLFDDAETRFQGHTPATFSAIAQYCDTLTERLSKQDQQLFSLADRLLSIDDWFAIGAQFLSDDEETYTHHRAPVPSVPQLVAFN